MCGTVGARRSPSFRRRPESRNHTWLQAAHNSLQPEPLQPSPLTPHFSSLTSQLRITLAAASCLIGLVCGSAALAADAGASVPLTPHSSPVTSQTPATKPVAAAPAVAPLVIDDMAIILPDVIDKLKNGSMTLEDAWEKGDLNVERVQYLLSADGRPLVGDLGPGLVGLLAKHKPDAVEDPAKLGWWAQMWLADYYRRTKDPLAEAVLVGLTDQCKERTNPGKEPAEYRYVWPYPPAMLSLGEYYRDVGQYQKAADAFVAAVAQTDVPNYVGSGTIEAARMYRALGDDKKAGELYQGIGRSGDAWAEGVALYDQARTLVEAGKYTEAQALLTKPVTGSQADQARVILLMMLGYTYYRTRDLDRAREYSQQAIHAYQSLASPLAGAGLEEHVTAAKRTLSFIDLWKGHPLSCEPKELTIALDPGAAGHRVVGRVTVQLQQRAPITVTCDNPEVQVRPALASNESDNEYFYGNLVIVTVPAGKKSFDAELTVKTPGLPNFEVKVPVHVVEVQKDRR